MGSLERAPELVEREVLAAQDAVDVEAADLHAPNAVLLEGFLQLLGVHAAERYTPSGRHGASFTYASTICSYAAAKKRRASATDSGGSPGPGIAKSFCSA